MKKKELVKALRYIADLRNDTAKQDRIKLKAAIITAEEVLKKAAAAETKLKTPELRIGDNVNILKKVAPGTFEPYKPAILVYKIPKRTTGLSRAQIRMWFPELKLDPSIPFGSKALMIRVLQAVSSTDRWVYVTPNTETNGNHFGITSEFLIEHSKS